MFHARKTVLVIDNELHILHVLSLKLRQAGYRVITAQDGPEGLELAQVERPDLVIADCEIPGLSGLELCQRLRQIPSTRNIPAIILTAPGLELSGRVMTAAGVQDCFDKPFAPREVVRRIEQILEPVGV